MTSSKKAAPREVFEDAQVFTSKGPGLNEFLSEVGKKLFLDLSDLCLKS